MPPSEEPSDAGLALVVEQIRAFEATRETVNRQIREDTSQFGPLGAWHPPDNNGCHLLPLNELWGPWDRQSRSDEVVRQKVATLDELYRRAPEAKLVLDQYCNRLAKLTNGVALTRCEVKPRDRAEEKVKADYNGDWQRLVDVVRASLVAKDAATYVEVATALLTNKTRVVKLKNRWHTPTVAGYRDLLFTVRIGLSDGVHYFGELVLHHRGLATLFFERTYVSYLLLRPLLSVCDTTGVQAIVDTVTRATSLEQLLSIADETMLRWLGGIFARCGAAKYVVAVRLRLVERAPDAKCRAAELACLGYLYRDLRDPRAEHTFLASIEACDTPEVRVALGRFYFDYNRRVDAEAHFRSALRLAQTAPNYTGLATLLHATGRLDEAIDLYRRTVDLVESTSATPRPHPENWLAAALNNLGAALSARGDYADAEAAYSRALNSLQHTACRDEPLCVALRLHRAAALCGQHCLARARHACRAAPAPFTAYARCQLAWIEARAGDFDAAKALLARAHNNESDDDGPLALKITAARLVVDAARLAQDDCLATAKGKASAAVRILSTLHGPKYEKDAAEDLASDCPSMLILAPKSATPRCRPADDIDFARFDDKAQHCDAKSDGRRVTFGLDDTPTPHGSMSTPRFDAPASVAATGTTAVAETPPS